MIGGYPLSTRILERLREETAAQHEQIEQNPYAKAAFDQTLTIDQYRSYLAKFYGFIKPAEKKFMAEDDVNDMGLDMSIRMKSKHLEEDLMHLDMTQDEINQLPLCSRLPELGTPAQIWGYLYVMEGSTLGGQIITKQLMKFLPVSPESGIRYFHAYGQETKPRWTEFREALLSSGLKDSDEIIDSAKETFRLLDAWIRDSA